MKKYRVIQARGYDYVYTLQERGMLGKWVSIEDFTLPLGETVKGESIKIINKILNPEPTYEVIEEFEL